jgi:DHA3 family macrolide efflux protein-like MFS transporter
MTRFFTIFTGQAFSLFGSRLVQFSIVWWLTKESGSASVLAFASIMALLPQVLIAPFAGAFVDRWNRRVVMIVADGLIALAIVALVFLYAQGVVEFWHIYALMLFRSAGGAFHWPAMQASTTLMVPKKNLPRVSGLNQSLHGLANIVTPPLGALLLELIPIQSILAIDVGTAVIAIVPLLFIPIPQPPRSPLGEQPSVLADMREGIGFLWGWRGVMMLVAMAMFINLLATPAMSLTPILVTNHFGGGARELATLQSAMGFGMVLGGLALGAWGGFKSKVVTGLAALVMEGVGLLVVGFVPKNGFLLAVGAVFFFMFMNPISNGSLIAVLQSAIPPEMQGRVFTLLMSGSAAMTPIGLAFAGPVADLLGVQIWFIVGGVAILVIGSVAFFTPPIMRIEDRVVKTPE